MKKLMICLLGLPLALSGCVTAEEMAAKQAEFKAQVATADNSDAANEQLNSNLCHLANAAYPGRRVNC